MQDREKEIKEILDRLFVYKNENDEMKYQPEDILTIDDVWLLLDCITSLQEEKNDLLDMCSRKIDEVSNLQKDNKKLKELCDKYEEEHKTTFEEWKKDIKANKKAIEYIELGLANEEEAEELLNILQGSDKE